MTFTTDEEETPVGSANRQIGHKPSIANYKETSVELDQTNSSMVKANVVVIAA